MMVQILTRCVSAADVTRRVESYDVSIGLAHVFRYCTDGFLRHLRAQRLENCHTTLIGSDTRRMGFRGGWY